MSFRTITTWPATKMKKAMSLPIAPATIPIFGDQDHVQHSIHGNRGEGQWDPAPGFTEVVDTQSEQWTDPTITR